jgi:serine-type D-Ala-D-Ala carboxypeptidase/endopeptidase (penicillin-binding protein 4)
MVRRTIWFVLAVALLVPSLVLAQAAVRADARADRPPLPLPVASPLEQGAVATPLLSWRRAPALLVGPARQAAALAAVQPLTADLPEGSCFMAQADGQPLVEVRGDRRFVPASNQKVLVAFTALQVLGDGHRARTSVVAGAPPADGVVAGDLVLVGGGDRFLSTAAGAATWEGIITPTSLESLADATVAAGVRRVDGRVLGDEGRYESARSIPSWPDRYLATRLVVPLGALQVDGRGSFSNDPSPAAVAADVFAGLLQDRGVVIGVGSAVGSAPDGAVELAGVDGPPLAEVVREVLTRSDNTTAELLLRELAVATGRAGTSAEGAAVVAEVIGAVVDAAGVPRSDVVVVDGSGLDPGNEVTCRALMAVLHAAGPDGVLAAGMAVAGRPGTLAARFAGSSATDRFRGKTGSIRDVLTLSGYVDDAAGRRWTFAFLVNGARAESEVARWRPIVEAIVAAPGGPDPAAAAPLPAG